MPKLPKPITLDNLIEKLKKCGATESDLKQVSHERLQYILERVKIDKLDVAVALKLITLPQILNISGESQKDIPSDINIAAFEHKYFDNPFESKDANFVCDSKNNKIEVTYIGDSTSKAWMTISFNYLNADQQKIIQDSIKSEKVPATTIVQDWYLFRIFSDAGNLVSYNHYCPAQHLLFTQTCTKDFPIEEFDKKERHTRPYYEEKEFVEFIQQKSKLKWDAIKQLPGMTQDKLFCFSRSIVQRLLNALFAEGFSIQQIAQIDEHRMKFIVQHQDAIPHALALTSGYELVGLQLPEVKINHKELPKLNKVSTIFSRLLRPHTQNVKHAKDEIATLEAKK